MTRTPHFLVPKSFIRIGPSPLTGSKLPSPTECSAYIIYIFPMLFTFYLLCSPYFIAFCWKRYRLESRCEKLSSVQRLEVNSSHKNSYALKDTLSYRSSKSYRGQRTTVPRPRNQKIVADSSCGQYPKFIACSNNKRSWNMDGIRLKVWSEKYKPLEESRQKNEMIAKN